MKTLDEIKQLMVADETAQADEALKELLAAEPNNLQAKMLYGTCRQLLGDEETFKRIHDELVPELENMPSQAVDAEMWLQYKTLYSDMRKDTLCTRQLTEDDRAIRMEYVVLAILILIALVTGVWFLGKEIKRQIKLMTYSLTTYAGPQYSKMAKMSNTQMLTNEYSQIVTNIRKEVKHIRRDKKREEEAK